MPRGDFTARIRIGDLEPIAATRAKVILGEILYETSVNRRRFVGNRQGRPVSVIMSSKEYCELVYRRKEVREKGTIRSLDMLSNLSKFKGERPLF